MRNENTNILKDLVFLYELSLSIGQSLNLEENIQKFVDVLMSQKNLDYASVWIYKHQIDSSSTDNDVLKLIYSNPQSFIIVEEISNPAVSKDLAEQNSFQINSNDENFADYLFEQNIDKGTFLFYKLGDLGFLKLYDSKRQGFSKPYENKLLNIIAKFKVSVEACIYYDRSMFEKSERINSLKQVAYSESKLRNIFNSMVDAYGEVDFRTRNIIEVTPSIVNITGYSREELLGRKMWEFYEKEKDDENFIFSELIQRNGELVDQEIRLRSKSGGIIPCSFSGRIIYNKERRPDKVVGTLRDITYRKLSEKALMEAEQRWRTLVNNSPDNIFAVDKEGKIIFQNSQTEDTANNNNIGKQIYSLIPEHQQDKYKKCITSSIGQKKVVSSEVRGIDNKWYLSRFVPVLNRDRDKVDFLMIIATDISKQKEMERQLSTAMEQAETANRAKSLFLANMSHEIRNPMSAIIGNADLLMDTPLNKQQDMMLNNLRISADNLLDIINNILDISKIEAGQLILEESHFVFEQEMTKIMDSIQIKASSHQLDLILEIDDNIPRVIYGDRIRIKQVLLNLLSNASKFTKNGFVKLSSKLDKRDENNNLILSFSVQDSGVGIEPDKLDTVFESFKQEDKSTAQNYGGTGLGLSITKQLVELMGGKIGVESVKGIGSNFYFTIVVKEGDEDAVENLKEEANATPNMLEGKTILVVDDAQFNQDVCERILSNWGAEVLIADNGEMAVEKIKQKGDSIDFVFMDVRMPIMDGIEATKLIREEIKWDKPIVALTGEALKEKIEDCMVAGMNDYISKPFKQASIEKKLRKYLNLGSNDVEEEIIPPTEDSSDNSILDVQYSTKALLEMINGNQEQLKTLLETFVVQSRKNVESLKKAYEENNWEQIQTQAHTIKTSLKYLDIDKYADLCQELENIARDRDETANVGQMIDTIDKVVQLTAEKIMAELGLEK